MIEIPLTQDKVATISDCDAELVDGLSICAVRVNNKKWYASATVGGKNVYLHTLIMQTPEGMEVDHIDGDGLHCERENMRLATHAQNMRNVGKNQRNTTGYKGVYRYHHNRDRFRMGIRYEGKLTFAKGTYPTAESAARAYDIKCRELHGDFARLNFPDEHLPRP